ncbi:hypothetical protein Tco_1455868 [Tanacetum coccineum]
MMKCGNNNNNINCRLIKVYCLLPAHNRCGSLQKKAHSKVERERDIEETDKSLLYLASSQPMLQPSKRSANSGFDLFSYKDNLTHHDDSKKVSSDDLRDALSVIFGLSVTQVTYTQISSPFADLSDIGSTGVDGSPMMLEEPYAYIVATYQAPPSPDYMSGPEEPQSPPPLDFVPEPMYHKYMPLKDEILPAEEQPLPAAATPTADSPGYVPEFDPEEEPEAEDDEDPEEDPVDYLANRDDDDEEEKEEPSEDDVDDEDEDEDKDEEEEEEHPAPADFIPPVHRMTARISIQDEPFISLPPRE